MEISTSLESLMRRCLALAAPALAETAPNPMVGCVVARDGLIIGEGHHHRVGTPHAEVHALRSVKNSELIAGSTLVVNLEPCAHHGRTPPCAELVARSGVRRVVIATLDPNPLVAGKGVAFLREHGIDVQVGVGALEAIELNRRFFTAQVLQRPYVILKWAETADGFMARADGTSKWISNEASRARVQQWRSEEQTILVGYRTAVTDNPHLTARIPGARQPVRVILDRDLSLPETLNIFNEEAETLVVSATKEESFRSKEVLHARFDEHLVSDLLAHLQQRHYLSVFVEGGAATLRRFIDSGLWDEARVFRAPVRFGVGLPAPHIAGPADTIDAVGDNQLSYWRNRTHCEQLVRALAAG